MYANQSSGTDQLLDASRITWRAPTSANLSANLSNLLKIHKIKTYVCERKQLYLVTMPSIKIVIFLPAENIQLNFTAKIRHNYVSKYMA